MPAEVVPDGMNVSGKVLDTHHAERSEERKGEQRRTSFGNVGEQWHEAHTHDVDVYTGDSVGMGRVQIDR